jgi:hypothetical protein
MVVAWLTLLAVDLVVILVMFVVVPIRRLRAGAVQSRD